MDAATKTAILETWGWKVIPDILGAANILKLHAMALAWVLRDDDNADETEACQIFWEESYNAVAGDYDLHISALNLSIELWPNVMFIEDVN